MLSTAMVSMRLPLSGSVSAIVPAKSPSEPRIDVNGVLSS